MLTVHGVVRDTAGKPVPGATVRLERKDGTSGTDGTTTADGSFAFARVPDGVYAATARKAGMVSHAIDVKVDSSAAEEHGAPIGPIVLEIADASPRSDAKPDVTAQMEFSDAPNFTIAAVTDWTGAGGHGSDAILRTSESLARDAVQMKGAGSGVNGPADSAVKQVLAFEQAGDYAKARQLVGDLLATEKTGDRLRLAGELDEKLGNPVAAVNEFEQALRAEGSEENYFAWGSELLLHRAILQSRDIFTAGAQRYPNSARMLTALGAALFASSMYDDAAQKLCQAANLSPELDEPYLFLGKVEMASPDTVPCAQEKLAEFVKRRPGNALASYYAAIAMWKQNGKSTEPQVLERVEAMLGRAVALDPKCSDAYLQLGNLKASERDYTGGIADYMKAIEADPQLAEAHYRLGLAYDRVGEKEKAKREFAIHEELDKQQAAEVERQRREVKQFLVKGSGAGTSTP